MKAGVQRARQNIQLCSNEAAAKNIKEQKKTYLRLRLLLVLSKQTQEGEKTVTDVSDRLESQRRAAQDSCESVSPWRRAEETAVIDLVILLKACH